MTAIALRYPSLPLSYRSLQRVPAHRAMSFWPALRVRFSRRRLRRAYRQAGRAFAC